MRETTTKQLRYRNCVKAAKSTSEKLGNAKVKTAGACMCIISSLDHTAHFLTRVHIVRKHRVLDTAFLYSQPPLTFRHLNTANTTEQARCLHASTT